MDELAQDEIDLRGLKCPLPALMARRALRAALPGTTLRIVADDPMAAVDVPHMCHQENYDVVSLTRDGDVTRFVLKRPV
ncbi:MAG TPA: sulfurtransferase TusA family protein [Rhizomicrobium sp.]|nr:sulfurtransferase TusA family protein [Rhizomicrobium sp.]